MTKTEFLEDTIQYFSAPNKRCVSDFGSCFYSPQNSDQTGCAIGRFMTPENAQLADEIGGVDGLIYERMYADYRSLIPEFMLEWEVDFLNNVQRLHDDSKYWKSGGLSEAGKKYVQEIKENFL
jgi:hypothetical protein